MYRMVSNLRGRAVTASAFRGLVSAAALLAVLAFAHPARASVVHRTVNQVITGSGTATFDVNGDGVGDFTITQYFSYNLRGGGCQYIKFYSQVTPATGNGIVNNGTANWASALKTGSLINGGQSFDLYPNAGLLTDYLYQGANCQQPAYHIYGYWLNTGSHYLGVKFKLNGATHYGYALLSVVLSGRYGHDQVTTTITEYAYETTPDAAIVAGQ